MAYKQISRIKIGLYTADFHFITIYYASWANISS